MSNDKESPHDDTNRLLKNFDMVIENIKNADKMSEITIIMLKISCCVGCKDNPHTGDELEQHLAIIEAYLFSMLVDQVSTETRSFDEFKNSLSMTIERQKESCQM